jgi:hypothetical protein
MEVKWERNKVSLDNLFAWSNDNITTTNPEQNNDESIQDSKFPCIKELNSKIYLW